MPDTEKLLQTLIRAKKSEDRAKLKRLAAEVVLIDALESDQKNGRTEGAKSYDVGKHSVTITAKINRKMDWVRWDSIRGEVPANLWPVREKSELDAKGVRWLMENNKPAFKIVASCMTTTPGKTAVAFKKKA